jgi:hypothetical protein
MHRLAVAFLKELAAILNIAEKQNSSVTQSLVEKQRRGSIADATPSM